MKSPGDPPRDAASENARLRQAAERAATELAHARARLDAVMRDVGDLAPALKTTLCIALEEAVKEVRAAENCLLAATEQADRSEP